MHTFPSFSERKILNHEPNLISFNDLINEDGKLGENIVQCWADLRI